MLCLAHTTGSRGLHDPCHDWPQGLHLLQVRDSQMLSQAGAYLQQDHFVPGQPGKFKTASAASYRDLARWATTHLTVIISWSISREHTGTSWAGGHPAPPCLQHSRV